MPHGAQYPLGSCPTPGLVWIAGSFEINATSNPDANENVGRGWSVVRSDVGKFTVTLDRAIRRPIAVLVSNGLTADDKEYNVHTGTIDETTTLSSFIIYATVGATDTDTDALRISFLVIGSDTTASK